MRPYPATVLPWLLLAACTAPSPPKRRLPAPANRSQAARLVIPTASLQSDLLQSLGTGLIAGEYSELRDFLAAHPGIGDPETRERDHCPYDRQRCVETVLRPNLEPSGDPAPFRETAALVSMRYAPDRLYQGTVDNHRARFDMIWDAEAGRIVYLRTLEGYTYFEYPLRLTENSLERVDGSERLRRRTTGYEEVVELRRHGLSVRAERDEVVPFFETAAVFSPTTWSRPFPLPDTSSLDPAGR